MWARETHNRSARGRAARALRTPHGNMVNLYAGKSGTTAQTQTQLGTSFLDFDIASASGASGRYDLRIGGNTIVSLGRSGGAKLGFYGTAPIAKGTLTGNWVTAPFAVVAKDLATLLHNLGLITDNTVLQ